MGFWGLIGELFSSAWRAASSWSAKPSDSVVRFGTLGTKVEDDPQPDDLGPGAPLSPEELDHRRAWVNAAGVRVAGSRLQREHM